MTDPKRCKYCRTIITNPLNAFVSGIGSFGGYVCDSDGCTECAYEEEAERAQDERDSCHCHDPYGGEP